MENRYRPGIVGLAVAATTFGLATTAVADAPTHPLSLRNVDEMTFAAVPGMPTCAQAAVQHGDPSNGPSVLIAKLSAGCTVPWHFHAPNEHVMMVSGVARMEMRDRKATTLRAGAYALMPSRHVHQFRCIKACTFYVHSDAAFDIQYVDAEGKVISAAEALKRSRGKVTARR